MDRAAKRVKLSQHPPSDQLAIRPDGKAYDFKMPERKPYAQVAAYKSTELYDPQQQRVTLGGGSQEDAKKESEQFLTVGWILPGRCGLADLSLPRRINLSRKIITQPTEIDSFEDSALQVGFPLEPYPKPQLYALIHQPGSELHMAKVIGSLRQVFFYAEYRTQPLTREAWPTGSWLTLVVYHARLITKSSGSSGLREGFPLVQDSGQGNASSHIRQADNAVDTTMDRPALIHSVENNTNTHAHPTPRVSLFENCAALKALADGQELPWSSLNAALSQFKEVYCKTLDDDHPGLLTIGVLGDASVGLRGAGIRLTRDTTRPFILEFASRHAACGDIGDKQALVDMAQATHKHIFLVFGPRLGNIDTKSV